MNQLGRVLKPCHHSNNVYIPSSSLGKPSEPCNMWNQLPLDLLARIFSFLSADSFARAASSCQHWHTCAKNYPSSILLDRTRYHPPWFLATYTRNRALSCYAYNPSLNQWHSLPLDFLTHPIRPIAPVGNLILYKPSTSSTLQLALLNPFTRQYHFLPQLNTSRTNPTIGVVEIDSGRDTISPAFRIYVAGGMSNVEIGGTASYELTLEMYDSRVDNWKSVGLMPIEFAVRLTIWTPNECVHSDGVLYWITSARAYSVIGFEVGSGMWKEVKVPMADRLEFAALVCRKGRLTLVGGGGEACIWELGEGDVWVLLERMPFELGKIFLGCKVSWCSTKCVGTDKALYLYRDLKSKMLVWREVGENGRWEWVLVEGCCSIRGEKVPNFPIKAVLLHPSLNPFYIIH